MWKTSSLNPKYEVNELGQVRNCGNKKILKGYLTKDGYRRFTMYDEKMNRRDRYNHVLVAYEFVSGRTDEKCFVNHKNFNKLDNRAQNLEWVTHQENMEHWHKNQPFFTQLPLNKNRESKLNQGSCPVQQFDLAGKLIQTYCSYMEAQRATGIRSGNISLCCRGKRHTAGGFVWRDLIRSSETIES